MDQPVLEKDILGRVCTVERQLPGGKTKHLDMDSLSWRTINRLFALIGLVKFEAFSVLTGSRLSPLLRRIRSFLLHHLERDARQKGDQDKRSP
jgi:hypothetical protein